MGKKTIAKAHFERAQKVALALKQEIPAILETGRTLAGLAQLLPKADRLQAIAELRRAIDLENQLLRGVLGVKEDQDVETPAVAEYYLAQAAIYAETEQKEDLLQAENLLAKAVGIREKLIPTAAELLAETFSAYAKVLSRLDKSEEAAKMEAKAEAARQQSSPLSSPSSLNKSL
jgi:hypothetical protein